MGKKDEYQYDYLDDYERFADQVNGALFGGRRRQHMKGQKILIMALTNFCPI